VDEDDNGERVGDEVGEVDEAKGFGENAGGVGVGRVIVKGDAAIARSAASLVSNMAMRGRSRSVSLRMSYLRFRKLIISPKPCSAAKICLLSARDLGGGVALMWTWEVSRVRMVRGGLDVILRENSDWAMLEREGKESCCGIGVGNAEKM
jgi:hypothetical protein